MPALTETALGELPASADTPALLPVGGTLYGRITSGDHDLIGLDVVAGQNYVIAMVGVGVSMLKDAFLQLRAADGTTLLAEDDDGLRNNNSVIRWTASETGRVYIDASGYGSKAGDYGVTVAQGADPSFDLALIAGIIDSHSSWSGTRGVGTNLTYAFRDSTTGGQPNFQHFTAGQMTDTRAVLAHFAEVTNLTFTEVNRGGYSNDATLLYGNYSANDGAGGYGSYPGSSAFTAAAGDVWVNDAAPDEAPAGVGSWFRELMLHEIGHTLGLSHPGSYNAGVGVSITYEANADFVQDSSQYTVMSYFGGEETGGTAGSPDTLMLADMLALQQIYGANLTTRATATVYGFGSNAGATYDFARNLSPLLTIWDGGGVDRLDASLYAMDQVLRLEAGSFSSTGGAVNNIAIAWGVTMENATGGRGDDLISGNAVANRLIGGWGADTLQGGGGGDILTGGEGADLLQGGLANDALYADGAAGGGAATFDLVTTDYSANQKVRANGVNLFPSGSFTVELVWQQNALVDEHYSLDIGNLSLYRYNNGDVALMFWGASEAGWNWGAVPSALTDGAAHRLSIAYNDATGLAQVYLDGALSWSHSFTPGTRALTATGNIVLDDDANIGDLRIFDHVRTASEIWANAWTTLDKPEAETGLVQYWKGNGAGQLISQTGGPDLITQGTQQSVQVSPQVTGSADTLEGGLGNDNYYIDSADDVIVEHSREGTDTLYAAVDYQLNAGAEVENLRTVGTAGVVLTGNELGQKLYSGAGADTLAGGLGRDMLYGGADGAVDVFLFHSVAEMGGGGQRDVLFQFTAGVDVIDLSQIDANVTLEGDQAFSLTGLATAFGVWLVDSISGLILRADVTGDAKADGELRLPGLTTMDVIDIML